MKYPVCSASRGLQGVADGSEFWLRQLQLQEALGPIFPEACGSCLVIFLGVFQEEFTPEA